MTLLIQKTCGNSDLDEVAPSVSTEDRTIRALQGFKIAPHFYTPVSRQVGFSLEFFELAQQWKKDTEYMSSLDEMCMNMSYLKIIAMGCKAVPFILHELEHDPDYWFIALQAITGCNPVPKEHEGNLDAMTRDWLIWGEQEGYDW